MKRFLTVFAAASCAVVTLLGMTGTAQAQDQQTQTRMRDYNAGEVWQTSGTWGRVRNRAGFEWTLSEPYLVRAVSQMQVDWPTGCTVGASISKSPELSVEGCTPKLAVKLAELNFRSISVPIRWTGPQGSGAKTCQWGTTGTEAQDFHETWTCVGEWMPQQDDYRYAMSTADLTADVKSDGDGLRDLPALSDTITFVQP